jgi:PurA ssDNA and RNA-binding protein
MTVSTSLQRAQIVIPAQGMIEIRDTLTELLKDFGTDDRGLEDIFSLLLLKNLRCELIVVTP